MEEILHHLGCVKPCKHWDKLPTSTGAGFLPSTVCLKDVDKKTPLVLRISCEIFDSIWSGWQRYNL